MIEIGILVKQELCPPTALIFLSTFANIFPHCKYFNSPDECFLQGLVGIGEGEEGYKTQ